METSTSRRVAALRQQLAPSEPTREMAGLSLAPTSAVQHELQLLLEHDSHAERERMKALMAGELFVP